VGDAGVFVGTVIGKARRGDENWLYIDVGVFNGLMESIGGIKYTYIVGSRGEEKTWTVAGPSCDSFDVIDKRQRSQSPSWQPHSDPVGRRLHYLVRLGIQRFFDSENDIDLAGGFI